MAHFSYISELDSMDMYFIDFYNDPFILNQDSIGLCPFKERYSVKYAMDEIKTRTGYFYIYSEVIIVDLLGIYGEQNHKNSVVVYYL